MDGAAEFVRTIEACFGEVEDPRVQASCEHSLLDILAITILGMTCGADDWTDLELFGRHREEWLRTFLKLPGGIPSHDTFQRVLGLLEPQQFAAGLFQWTQAIHEATGGTILAIDGKSLRRSFARKSGQALLHLVTAWASESGLTLGQVACEEKSNEITAIPQLLKMLSVAGCTVTIDAMGCQTAIAEQIREQGGHYLLAAKGNQSTLEADLQTLFDEAVEANFEGFRHTRWETSETGHGRREERTCHAIAIPAGHPQRAKWKDLRTLVVSMTRRTFPDGRETCEARLFITSHLPQAKNLAHAIRRHWSIENSQHWVLDMAFGEDARRQQDRNGATNLAAVRRLAVSLLRQEKTCIRGAKAKRMVCALDPGYLLKVMHTAKFDA